MPGRPGVFVLGDGIREAPALLRSIEQPYDRPDTIPPVHREELSPMSIRLIKGAYLADTARVIGQVTLGRDVSVWYGAVVRGDVGEISIGVGSNVQECAVVHIDSGTSNHIGADVTIGHSAVVHGREVGDGTLIGIGAKVLGDTRIGRGCLIAAGAVVTPGTTVPDGMLVVGVPGKILRKTTEKEQRYLAWLGPHYINVARMHADEPDDSRVRPWGDRPGEASSTTDTTPPA